MTQKKNITIYDIAKEAGVSAATVSRILTGSAVVREQTKERVLALVEKYHYRPNAMARALTETRTRLIGMVMADTTNPYYNSVFAACASEAYSRGYMTVLFNTFSRPEMEAAALNKLVEQRVDAIILCGGRIDLEEPDPAFNRLLETTRRTTPVVVGSRSPMESIHGVAVDHEGSVDIALDYLIRQGHRDIGFVYAGEENYGTQLRLKRFRAGMEKAGLTVREEWMIPVHSYDTDGGRQGALRLMELAQRPTALLGMNDMVTAGILQVLLEKGVRVPEDISLMGFDDTFVTSFTTPRLTAVEYDYGVYARMLVDAAIAAMEEREIPQNQTVPLVLSIKGSCVAPEK